MTEDTQKWNARVTVFLKKDVMDPQGVAVEQALHSLGHEGVSKVRVGRAFEVDVAATDSDSAHAEIGRMCESLLANTVIERYEIAVQPCKGPSK